MTQRTRRTLFWLLLLALAVPFMVAHAAEEDEADAEPLPVFPYYTSSDEGARFNIPIPPGWQDVSTTEQYARLQIPGSAELGDIYTVAVLETDADAAALLAFSEINPDWQGEQIGEGSLRLDGLTWAQRLYDLGDDGTATAFLQNRDDVTFALIFHNPNPDADFYMLAGTTDVDDEDGAAVLQAELAALYPTVSDEPDDEAPVELSNGTWIQATYSAGDDTIHTLRQARFGVVYMVIERGDGRLLEQVNKSLFTVLFGFFVTPENDDYLNLGIASVFALLALLIGSMWLRHRNLEKDVKLLAQLQDED